MIKIFVNKLSAIALATLAALTMSARDVNVADFGADGKSQDSCDAALQKAIDECSKTGGGEVKIGQGVYFTSGIVLKDSVTLAMADNAVIKMKPLKDKNPVALVLAEGAKNVGIRGGTLDGSGKLFLQKDLSRNRPYTLLLKNTKGARIENCFLTNSAFWTFRILGCDGVFVRGVKIYSHTNFNNDGIDIDGRNVTVSDCIIDCDDDGLCLKSEDKNSPVENVTITNCVVASNCNPIKFGTANANGFRNITISNCTIRACAESNYRFWNTKNWMKQYGVAKDITGIAGIALEAVDGGFLENVAISNITMRDIHTPIFIRSGHRNKGGKFSRIKNVSISNIVAESQSWISNSITGVKESPVQNVSISNCIFTLLGGGPVATGSEKVPEVERDYPENRMFKQCLPSYGMYIRHADNITLDNVQFLTHGEKPNRPSIVADDVFGLRVLDCAYQTPPVYNNCPNLKKSGNITIESRPAPEKSDSKK